MLLRRTIAVIVLFVAFSWQRVAGNISTFPWFQNFEVSSGNMLIYGTAPSWAWGIPNDAVISSAGQGLRAWVTNLSGDYNPNEDAYIELPCFNFSTLQYPWIAFKFISEMETSWEDVWMEYSTDTGVTWNKLGNHLQPANCEKQNWYNGGAFGGWTGRTTSSCFGSSCPGQLVCGQWVTAWHCLTTPVDLTGLSDVRFRFYMDAGTTCQDEGFGIDSLYVGESVLIPDFTASCVGTTVNFLDQSWPCSVNWTWDFGDGGPTSNAQHPTHIYPAPGPYLVKLVTENGCGLRDSVTKLVDISGFTCSVVLQEHGIEWPDWGGGAWPELAVQTWPNPVVTDLNLRVQTTAERDLEVEVFDMAGIRVLSLLRRSDRAGRFEGSLALGGLARGTYLLQVKSGFEKMARRVVVGG